MGPECNVYNANKLFMFVWFFSSFSQLGFQEENFLNLVWVVLEDGKQRTHGFCINKELQYWRDQWQQQQWSWGQH